MTVEVEGLSKTFADVAALDAVDLLAGAGEFVVVVGPSGSGKSTLLRCIAGLESPDAGTVKVGGTDVTSSAPGARDVAMVFQDYALYPHLDVATNIAFPLLARKTDGHEVESRVQAAAEMLGLLDVLSRRPSQLSGGERRRVALARAVVRDPSAFLMDEPLASLDVALKRKVQIEIRDLQTRTGTTTIYVTHDQIEAMMLATELAVMRAGRIEQTGPPQAIYEHPANTFVASFLGRTPMNLFPGALIGLDEHTVGVRPEHIRIEPDRGRLAGTVRAIDELGAEKVLEISCDGRDILAEVEDVVGVTAGDDVSLGFDDRHLHRFGSDGRAVG